MHRTFCGKMSWVKSNKLLPDMKWCDTTLQQEFEIKTLHKSPLEKEQFYIRIYSNIFECIRIINYSYSYSVIFSDRIIFVFVFGGNFSTNNIRIRMKFFNEYYSYSYSEKKCGRILFVFVFGLQKTIRSPLVLPLRKFCN